MRASAVLATVLLALSASGCGGGDDGQGSSRSDASAARGAHPLPASMAALGDSITRAAAACDGPGDCPEASWSTGSLPGLDSHAQRLAVLRGDTVETHNLARSGAAVRDLGEQARRAVGTGADYVTVLIGGNDACAATESAMTPVDEFAADFGDALGALVTGLPDARVLVVSIPDVGRLWEVGRGEPSAVRVWEAGGVCPTLLAGAVEVGGAAEERRARVRERVAAYNAAMEQACARHTNCRWDGGAVFAHPFGLDAVSGVDAWHPSAEGQEQLAELSWSAGFWG